MAVKYYGEYLDPEGNEFRFEISSTPYAGSSSEINGYCVVENPEAESIFDPIRGSGMRISLDADETIDFDDLWTDEERVWLVTLERESVEVFRGFLTPEGVYQDFVNAEWVIELDVVDGLGYLENLSYVDGSGNTFSGLQTAMEIIVNCLNRSGITLDIYTAVDLVYTGLSESLDVLTNAKFKADRFVRDDGETIMDCKEVLTDILGALGACICQYNGAWYVYRPSKLMNIGAVSFFHYNSSGVLQGTDSQTFDLALGSFSAAFYPHWCNENQRFSMRNSLGAFRVNYKYGLDDSIFVNPNLEWDGNDTTIDGWTKIVDADVTSGEQIDSIWRYIKIDVVQTPTSPADVIETDNIEVSSGDALTIDFDVNSVLCTLYFYIELDDDASTDVYRLDANGQWELSGSTIITYVNGDGAPSYTSAVDYNVKVGAAAAPVDGQMKITFQNPLRAGAGANNMELRSFKVYPSKENQLIQGEFHTVERTVAPSSKTEDVKEVFHGDNDTNIFYGTIYKADGVTKTSTWNRKGVTESLALLQIIAEDHLRAAASPSRRFEGDIYGYIGFLSTPTINGLTGVYHILYYKYDTFSNVISLILQQVYTDEVADIDYELTYDYGETVKPTIRG